MTAIKIDFGTGGTNLTPGGSGEPTLAQTLRDVADDLAALNTRQKAIQAAMDSKGVHVAADTTNAIGSPVATDPTVDTLALLNDAVVQYEAHRILTAGSVHGAADTTNAITATNPATTEAEGIALGNDLKAMYEAHRVLTGGGVHGAADNTNTIASSDATDWDSLVTLVNEFKNTTAYEAHRVLVAGSVHGGADSTNVITAADAGVQTTALYLEVNEFKTALNAHIAHLGVHPEAGTANSTTTATTEATAVAMINGVKETFNTHSASAADHLDADTEVVAGTATEYEDIIAVVAEWKAAYEAHVAKSDALLGTGGEVTILTTKQG